MPLPAALAAKLAKRGLQLPIKLSEKENKFSDNKIVSACPNKYNVYHECTSWCQSHWKPQTIPDAKYLKNIKKLLEKYPLPANCTELYDSGVGRYFYWDMDKNLVSWLPPTHPKAIQTEPATKLKIKRTDTDAETTEQSHRDIEKRRERHKDRKERDRDDRRSKYEDKDRSHKRNKRDEGALDPMDPAAYSDVPRGGWNEGLENNRIKADSTASGSLFQQRPYPSPGDVLEANKQNAHKKK